MNKTYQGLSELYKAPDHGADIKKRGLESLECVIRMEQAGVVKTICGRKPKARRKVEMLRFKWMGKMENDL